MGNISSFAVIVAVLLGDCLAQIQPEITHMEWPQAGRVFGNLSSQAGFLESKQDLFGRQTCGQGYSQCNYVGDCCPQTGPNCCGNICVVLYPAGSACCSGYLCPPDWRCCGTVGNHCSPNSGTCCSADGRYCPANWSCCGNQGYCYPTEGFHCCSNDGTFCPNGSKCVYCTGSSTRICCQGPDGVIVPPYTNNNPTDTAPPVPPSTAQPPTSQQATPATSPSQPATPGTPSNPTAPAAVTQYYSTTFTYTYIVWTRITYIQSVVDSTVTTTSTVLSCLATDQAAAAPTLSALAFSVQASASSSALAASPAGTASTATTAAATAVPTGGKASAAPGRFRGSWIREVALSLAVGMFIF